MLSLYLSWRERGEKRREGLRLCARSAAEWGVHLGGDASMLLLLHVLPPYLLLSRRLRAPGLTMKLEPRGKPARRGLASHGLFSRGKKKKKR